MRRGIKDPEFAFVVVGRLGRSQRAILSLRCFNSMSFEEIADIMDCTLAHVRRCFRSSKIKILTTLRLHGIDKKAVIELLADFGMLTGGGELKTNNARIEELVGSLFLARIVSRLKVMFRAAVLSCLMMAVCTAAVNAAASEVNLPARSQVTSADFTIQGASFSGGTYASYGFYEYWVYFPEGPDGPVFYRMQRFMNKELTSRACSWMGNGDGVYYFHSGERKLYINNDSLSMDVLPTDGQKVLELAKMCVPERSRNSIQYIWNGGGLLESVLDSRVPSVGQFRSDVKYNTVSADFFTRDQWGIKPVEIIDQRDQMHKRGWTYVDISGSYDGRNIEGKARIPFRYNMSKTVRPWLNLKIGEVVIEDCNTAAIVTLPNGTKRVYDAGTFFIGMPRPWRGYCVRENILRDAAAWGCTFKAMANWAAVNLENGGRNVKLAYSFDSDADTLNMIGISDGNTEGMIMFKYHQDVNGLDASYAEPKVQAPAGLKRLQTKGGWLLDCVLKMPAAGIKPLTAADANVPSGKSASAGRSCRPAVF